MESGRPAQPVVTMAAADPDRVAPVALGHRGHAPGGPADVLLRCPGMADVAARSRTFATLYSPPPGPPLLAGVAGSAIDLSDPALRTAMLRWLNSWGCRLPYPRPGEVDRFDSGVATWWAEHGRSLPTVRTARLTDPEIAGIAASFGALCGLLVGSAARPRRIGPTAAAKALYALRPDTVVPWDAAIAVALHGDRDAGSFDRHLRLGRRWVHSLMEESGLDDTVLPAAMGRPGTPLPKILDDYCYLTFTAGM